MPVFGTQMFGSGGPLVGTIDHVTSFASGDTGTSWTFSGVDFGTGGKLIIGIATGPSTSVSSWTADGQTITTRTALAGSEVTVAIGTVDVSSSTSGAIVINTAGSAYRMLGHVWDVSNVDLTTVSSNPTADKSWTLSYGTISAGGVAVAVGYDQNGTGFTGATGLTYDGITAVTESAAAAGASKAFDSAQSDYAFNFDGSRHADGSGVGGLALPQA